LTTKKKKREIGTLRDLRLLYVSCFMLISIFVFRYRFLNCKNKIKLHFLKNQTQIQFIQI